jgi:polyisoprenoid-binding protein YceI
MTFSSTTISEDSPGAYVVSGVLSVNGRSNPLDLAVEFHGTGTYPVDGTTHAGFSATGSVSRRAYGIEFNVPMEAGGVVIGDRIAIELDAQLAAPAAAQAA